jgi:hypothetical protein
VVQEGTFSLIHSLTPRTKTVPPGFVHYLSLFQSLYCDSFTSGDHGGHSVDLTNSVSVPSDFFKEEVHRM